MKPKAVLLLTATLVVGFGLGYVVAKPFPPSGTGQYKDAPNGALTAWAFSMSEDRLLDGRRDFYSFSLTTPGRSSSATREIRIEAPSEADMDWREEGKILWDTNST